MKSPLRFSIFLVSAGTLLLAGCVAYRPQPLSAPAEADAFAARTLDAPAVRAFFAQHGASDLAAHWPLPMWDERALTLAAWCNHPDLAVAQAKLAAADAASITAGARPNPTIGIGPTYDANSAGGVSPWTLGFTLDWPIETAGKRGDRIAQAQAAANRARLDVVQAAWDVRSRVRQALVELETAQRRRAVLVRQSGAQREAVKMLEARLKAGESSITEVQLVRLAAGQSALDLADAEKDAAQARIRLAAAVGVPAEALVAVKIDFGSLDRLPTVDDVRMLRRNALLHRADVLGALADYEGAEAALRLEIAKQYPDFHLGPGYSWDQGENKYSLGLSLTLPVLDRNRGPIAEAEAQRRAAAARVEAVQAQAASEVEQAAAAYRAARGKLRIADSLQQGQRDRLDAIQRSFAVGALDRLELVQAQTELGTDQLARAVAFGEAQLALGELESATQQPVPGTAAADVPSEFLQSLRSDAGAQSSHP